MSKLELRTITEVVDGKITISCEVCEVLDRNPNIFKAEILDKEKTVNKTNGIEGELLLSHYSDENPAKISDNGDLIINGEDADKYRLDDNGDLIYVEE